MHGLVALMELQASRTRARIGPSGEAVLLLDQDRVALGLAARRPRPGRARPRAEHRAAPSARTRSRPRSPPATPRARVAEETDWERIVALYDGLAQLLPSPVVELNRAVAVGMAFGPRGGARAGRRPRVPSPRCAATTCCRRVRGDLLARLGRDDEARAEFERAASLTRNSRERDVLLARVSASAAANGTPGG